MNTQNTREERVLSIVADASNWTQEEVKLNIGECLPILTIFISHTDDIQIGIQVTRFAFGVFLPHLPMASVSDKLLDGALPALLNHLRLLTEEAARGKLDKPQECLDCLILSVEACQILLNYVMHQSEEGNTLIHIKNTPNSVCSALKMILHHYQQRNEIYQSAIEDLGDLFDSLLKEVINVSSLLCEVLMKLQWEQENDLDSLNLLAEVCEDLSEIAHSLSCLSVISVSVVVWKTFTSLTQAHSEDLKRRISLRSSIQYLQKEIEEGIALMKSLETQKCGSLSPNEEKVFTRILKRSCFNLKILITLSDKFKGFLRGSHQSFLSTLLLLLSHSWMKTSFTNLSIAARQKIRDQLLIGIEPLLQNLKDEQEFLGVVDSWLNDQKDEANKEGGSMPCGLGSFLLLLTALMKEALSDPLSTRCSKMWSNVLLKNVFDTFPLCHAELSLPQLMDGVTNDGAGRGTISLYTHTLVYTCALLSTLDGSQYEKAEKLLFTNALEGRPWSVLLASDVLCFVARYGSSSLCETHCKLLLGLLTKQELPEVSQRRVTSLLSRLLAFVKPQEFNGMLAEWLKENPEGKAVAEVIHSLSSPISPEIQALCDAFIFQSPKIQDQENRVHFGDMKNIFAYLEIVGIYCRSNAIEIQRIDQNLRSSVVEIIIKIFERFPSEQSNCSIVTRLFCLCLECLHSFIDLSSENIYMILSVCSDVIQNCLLDGHISVCGFLCRLGKNRFTTGDASDTALREIEGLFGKLLIHANPFVHATSLRALISFAKFTTHEEVFGQCVSQLPQHIQEEVMGLLQPELDKELPMKLEVEFLRHQTKLVNSAIEDSGNTYERVKLEIPLELQTIMEPEVEFDVTGSKRRKLEIIPLNKEEFLGGLEKIRSILSRNESLDSLANHDKNVVKEKLKELLEEWQAFLTHPS